MVCTDAAARGIDIPHVTHVVQSSFAASAVDFLHRVSPIALASPQARRPSGLQGNPCSPLETPAMLKNARLSALSGPGHLLAAPKAILYRLCTGLPVQSCAVASGN